MTINNIHAEPSGNFLWTETYKDQLASFELNKNPYYLQYLNSTKLYSLEDDGIFLKLIQNGIFFESDPFDDSHTETEITDLLKNILEKYKSYKFDHGFSFSPNKRDKIENILTILDNYHNLDIFHFICDIQHKIAIPHIQNWFELFPIFTIKHVLDRLLNKEVTEIQYYLVINFMIAYLERNPDLSKPLHKSLSDTQQNYLTQLIKKPPIYTPIKLELKESNPNIQTLLAIPDNQYHFSKTQSKKLKTLENNNPHGADIAWSTLKVGGFNPNNLHESESAIIDFIQNYIQSHTKTNSNKGLAITECTAGLDTLYSTAQIDYRFKSSILMNAFKMLEEHLEALFSENDKHHALVDILHFYIIATTYKETPDGKCNIRKPSHHQMYELINRHTHDIKHLASSVSFLIDQYIDNEEIQTLFIAFFPEQFGLTLKLLDKYPDIRALYEKQLMHYFDNMDYFARILNASSNIDKEAYLLFLAKEKPEELCGVIHYIIEDDGKYKFPGWQLSRLKETIKVLKNYHHVDGLQLLIKYSLYMQIAKHITWWLDYYPLYTLSHLFIVFTHLNTKQQENIKTVMSNYIINHLGIITPLTEILNGRYNALLTTLTKNIPPQEINEAYQLLLVSSGATASELFKVCQPHVKCQSHSPNKARKIKFPTVTLNRIPNKTVIYPENFQSYDYVDDGRDGLFYDAIQKPKDNLFDIYYRHNLTEEVKQLEKNYAHFSEDQKALAHIFIKPSVLSSDKFKRASEGDYAFTNTDYILDGKTSLYFRYIDVIQVACRKINNHLKTAVFKDGIPDMLRHYYKSRLGDIMMFNMLHDVVNSCNENALTAFIDLVDLSDHKKMMKWILGLGTCLDGKEVIPYFINAFKTKTHKEKALTYFNLYPQTVIDEVVILLFTKQTTPLLKKAKTNARAVFSWFIDNHKPLVIETLQTYDKKLNNPILLDFLTSYESWQEVQSRSGQQDEATPKDQKLNTEILTNDTGVPWLLLNDDWQKATRKKSFEISSYIDKQIFSSLVLKQTNEKLPTHAFIRLLQMLMIQASKPVDNLLTILNLTTIQSQITLSNELWGAFKNLTYPKADKWLMTAQGYLYNEDFPEQTWQFIKDYESTSAKRGILKSAIVTLAEQAITRHKQNESDSLASENAIRMLMRIANKARTSLRPAAEEQLTRYAQAVGLNSADLADQMIPTLDLSAQGKREFDFGNRQFVMSLNSELKPTFMDNNGKKYKNLPKASKKDDAEKAKLAQKALKDLKKQLKSFITDDVSRLEMMLINRRHIDISRFQKYYLSNPLMLRVALTLIWGIYDDNQLVQPFKVVETGETLDINDDVLVIKNHMSNNFKVGMVHPIELTEKQREQFSDSLQSEDVLQPFLQLSRPVFYLTTDEKSDNIINTHRRYADIHFEKGYLLGLKNKGWIPLEEHRGVCNGFKRTINGKVWQFTFTESFDLWTGSQNDYGSRQIKPIKLVEQFSEAEISEFIYVLDSMARLAT